MKLGFAAQVSSIIAGIICGLFLGEKAAIREPIGMLFIKLMQQYSELAYRLTLLKIQKLAYFLQEAGQPLRLRYEAGHYGPYAPNLNKVLEALERHYTSGYGDSQKPDVEKTALYQGLKVLFYTLELEPEWIATRIDMSLTSLGLEEKTITLPDGTLYKVK